MKTLIFATNNKHKLQEVREMVADKIEIKSLTDVGLEGDIPETADTLEGNALQKARWVWERIENSKFKIRSSSSRASADNLKLKIRSSSSRASADNSSDADGIVGVFADDTGLEVEALDGQPGVYSARYAGEHCSFDDNINKMLKEMEGKTNRKACFRTVICLIENGEPRYFEGRVDGTILTERYGKEGFGYDPIFMPDRFAVSFAEMPLEVKNRISHRGRAVREFINFIVTCDG